MKVAWKMSDKRLLIIGVFGILVLSVVSRGHCVALQTDGGNTIDAARVINADDFGIHADGVSDDGPVIDRMLEAAASVAGAVQLVFPEDKIIRVITASDRYVFKLDHAERISVDGGGSTFLLAPDVRFLKVTNSRMVAFRNLNIDFDPLPFGDGTVTQVNAKERYIDVRPMSVGQGLPTGVPTLEDGEQRFFGMLWYPGAYGVMSRHYWVKRMAPGDEAGMVRVFAGDDFGRFGAIEPEAWRISLPVPGIAHRLGPGACLDIYDNEDVTFEDVELWSAPWFGFRVFRNRGEVTFRRVHIRPKPGSGRLTSTWRDGFHVKGNSATLLWEDCIVAGTNDDAFNISTHCSWVKRVISPTEIVVMQRYPLNRMPWHEGATFTAADYDTRTLLGAARIVKVTNSTETPGVRAIPVTIVLDRPIEGLEVGAMVWEPESTNPNTTLRRCRIEKSCRLQSPVTLEGCDVTALLWFYGGKIEGPFPSHVIVRDCVLRRGRGNERTAVSFAGRNVETDKASAIHDVVFEDNEVWGDFLLIGVDEARLSGNVFLESGATVRIENCEGLTSSSRIIP